ncbi:reverse transcriptase domain-containing protein [Tanacetum coccineum]
MGWRVCIDYHKLNEAIAKDHFPLPFMDQMRMPFGLCNAPTTFQRCMMAIFHDMIKESVKRCKDAHLVLNWEKCHFMVKEGIVLEHKVSSAELEVDKAKIDVISKLPPPTNIKGIRSFLGHAGFYQRFIKDFSKVARPLTKLLEKDTPFEFNDECQKVFDLLKEKLTCAPVIDRKGTENVAADHLSRIENDESSDDSDVDDNFPGETLMEINTKNEPHEAHTLVQLCEACQKTGNISKRDEMPLTNIQAEAQALPTNDARAVITFLKKLFCRFEIPKALISDRVPVLASAPFNAKSPKLKLKEEDVAIATACYTQNCSIIHCRFDKTPYELINGRKADIFFLHVFQTLCYPKNDHEDIGKLGAKGDIGFFIGYSANLCAFRVFNQRTRKILETMNVTFDELSAMAFEQRSSKPRLQGMTSGQISSELDLTYASSIITS